MGSISSDSASHVLFGATRRGVLSLLFGQPDNRFYFREILRAVGGGSGAVQRELKLLTEAGLIERDRDGHQVYYTPNRQSPIFEELRTIVEKTAGAAGVLRSAFESFVASGDILVAFVYGSTARGGATPRSDVDVLIVGSVTLADLLPALRAAEARLGREVNASVFPPAEFQTKFRRGNAFVKRVMAEPKILVAGDQHELEGLAR
jgi:predicted nucleotidyltransferase